MQEEDLYQIKESDARSLLEEVRLAFKRFKSKNELIYREGANEPGCPKNYIRGDIPRKFSPHLVDGKEPKNRYRGGRKS